MANDTRERILNAALTSFAENGYEGTNLLDVAKSVGIVKSAIYRHFSGKEDLWNAVIDSMEKYYDAKFGSAQNLPKVPQSGAELVTMTMHMVDFTMHDSSVIKTRKLLLMEQFRDERIKELATKHFLTGLEAMFAEVFKGMMANGSLKKDDPKMLALAYTAPISSLIHLCDREPEKEKEVLKTIKEFAKHFVKTYEV